MSKTIPTPTPFKLNPIYKVNYLNGTTYKLGDVTERNVQLQNQNTDR